MGTGVADTSKATHGAAYGVRYDVWKGHRGLAKRSVFVVDRDRVVRYRWVTDDALVLPDLDEAMQALRACAATS